jgi:hypothetical protein
LHSVYVDTTPVAPFFEFYVMRSKLLHVLACLGSSLLACDSQIRSGEVLAAKPEAAHDSDQAEEDRPRAQPLPADVVAAWRNAGMVDWWGARGSVGWVRIDSQAWLHFDAQPSGAPGEVPAFQITEWKRGVLPKLPQPAQGFGLCLRQRKVTDAGLQDLAGLTNLEALDLELAEISDAGLKHLSGLKRLRALDISHADISDAGLKQLAVLQDLRMLSLGLTNVTSAGLKALAPLKKLEALHLWRTNVTDDGLQHLAMLNRLEYLSLWQSKVRGTGFKALKPLKRLRTLEFGGG